MNNISPPDHIMIGQTLQIVTPQALNKAAIASQAAQYGGTAAPVALPTSLPAQTFKYSTPPNGETPGKVYLPKQAVPPSGASTNTPANQLASQLITGSTVSSKGLSQLVTIAPPPMGPMRVSSIRVVSMGGDEWSWPLTGVVAQKFGEGKGLFGKGIQLSAPAGTPVLAAAEGQVLYSGVGAAEYQQMVIVKQNNNFLTAYTNLSQITVKQAQSVKRGQQIGVIGSINDEPMLHFEVRKFGTPVNPITYMPKADGQ
jgi:lipoprotein NlpD